MSTTSHKITYTGKKKKEREKHGLTEVGSRNLEPKLGTAPVAALSVVADGVISPHANPIGDRPILPLLLRQLLLDHEGLV